MVRRTIPLRQDSHNPTNHSELKTASPRSVTRGLQTDVILEDCIDWLSLTFPSLDDVVYPDWWPSRAVDGKGMLGYEKSRRFADGRIELHHPTKPEMGVHCILGGEALQNLGGLGITELKIFLHAGAKPRRFDVARDIFNSPLSFGVLLSHIRRGKAVTKARSFPAFTANQNEGKTQYIGKKSSDCYCRIYDKAYEQGIDGLWHRIEAVFQGDKAEPAVKMFIAGSSVPSLLKSVIDFPDYPKWVSVCSSDSVTPLFVGRKSGNTKEWLLASVAPSLARILFLDNDDEFLIEFMTRVRLLKDNLEAREQHG